MKKVNFQNEKEYKYIQKCSHIFLHSSYPECVHSETVQRFLLRKTFLFVGLAQTQREYRLMFCAANMFCPAIIFYVFNFHLFQ